MPPELNQARVNKCLIALVNRKIVRKDNSTVCIIFVALKYSNSVSGDCLVSLEGPTLMFFKKTAYHDLCLRCKSKMYVPHIIYFLCCRDELCPAIIP